MIPDRIIPKIVITEVEDLNLGTEDILTESMTGNDKQGKPEILVTAADFTPTAKVGHVNAIQFDNNAQVTPTRIPSLNNSPAAVPRSPYEKLESKVRDLTDAFCRIEDAVKIVPELKHMIETDRQKANETVVMQKQIERLKTELERKNDRITKLEEDLRVAQTAKSDNTNLKKAESRIDKLEKENEDIKKQLKYENEGAAIMAKLGELQQVVEGLSRLPTVSSDTDSLDGEEDNEETTQESEDEQDVIVKGPDDPLSMMHKREPFTYRCRKHEYGETAYQMAKGEHTLTGQKRDDFLEQIFPMNGLDAKEKAKELPRRNSWQSMKREEVKNVARKMFNADPAAKEQLKNTGSKYIRHTVGDLYWGTGGVDKDDGDNEYGKILMELREEFFGPEFTINIRKDTKVILLTDSQGKHIKSKEFFGNDRVMVRRTSTASSLSDFARNAPANRPNVKKIIVGTGINNVMDSAQGTEDSIKGSMDILALKFPNAQIAFSAALHKSQNENVKQFNQNMEDMCKASNYKFVRQSIPPHLFEDEKHINVNGTKIMVSNIYRAFNVPSGPGITKQYYQKGPRFMKQGKGGPYKPAYGAPSHGNNVPPSNSQIPVHIGGRPSPPPYMRDFLPHMYGSQFQQGFYQGQGPYFNDYGRGPYM